MQIFNDLNDPTLFSLDRSRISLADRNDLVRLAVMDTLHAGILHLEAHVRWFKDFVGYTGLGQNDRNVVRVTATTIRNIVRGWSHLDQQSQRAFQQGTLLPSAAARLIKQACTPKLSRWAIAGDRGVSRS